jgi:hypothetical protein
MKGPDRNLTSVLSVEEKKERHEVIVVSVLLNLREEGNG